MSKRKKIFIGIGVALVVVVFMALALLQGRRGGVEVRTQEVKRRNLVAVVTAYGRIRPHLSVDIQAEVSGRIVDLRVEEGDYPEKGDTLLIIDPTTFKAAVRRARAALSSERAAVTQARANRDQAARSLERTRRIHQQSPELISDQELEAAETNFDVQEALFEASEFRALQAEANLQEARDRLAKTVIQAPITGRVTRLNVEQGETAIVGTMNNPGTVLLTVADLSAMEAVVEVDETDVPDIEIGDSTDVEIDAFPDRVFVGWVTEIAQSSIQGGARGLSGRATDQSVDFEVVIRLDDPPPELRPDLSATADVVTAIRDSVLAIPIIALTLQPRPELEEEAPRESEGELIELAPDAEPEDQEGVFVVEDDVAKFRSVKVGIAGRDYFEVVEGLEEGEIVVAGSYQAIRQLKDGSPVKTKGARSSRNRSEQSKVTESPGEEGPGVALAATIEGEARGDVSVAEAIEQRLAYSVLITSLSSLDMALERQQDWARPDLPVYVVPTKVRGNTYYRVLAGILPKRERAMQLMGALASDGVKESVQDWDVRTTGLAFHFGTFGDTEANAKIRELLPLGIPAYKVPAATTADAADRAYHVYAGGYEDADDATLLEEEIARAGLTTKLVDRVGVARQSAE